MKRQTRRRETHTGLYLPDAKPPAGQRYRYLGGYYTDEDFERKYTRPNLQAEIEMAHYKGHIILRVVDDRKERRTATQTLGLMPLAGSAWLRGDDIDRLIADLRAAKQVWLRNYHKAERHLAKLARLQARKNRKARR